MEFSASWSIDSSQSGLEQAASGFNARAIDFAKFGRLFLRQGNWNGKQILSAAWVKEATSPNPEDKRPWCSDQDWKDAGGYYKYHWWGLVNNDGTYDFTATGSPGGQIIYISPQNNAIVCTFRQTRRSHGMGHDSPFDPRRDTVVFGHNIQTSIKPRKAVKGISYTAGIELPAVYDNLFSDKTEFCTDHKLVRLKSQLRC